MAYVAYLRKSRADKEAEARGEGETLARHEKALAELAARQHLFVEAIYREVVSGETISARPKMQQLLIEVMQGLWEGVLVMEVERLARGDTKDQGTVAEAFKFSSTKIITPSKTFDPNNEFDEEYFEFNLFMSRREYKTINRRIQRGRTAAFQEGWYIAGVAPYGYEKVKHKGDKGYTLEIVEKEARIVRLIYDMYLNGEPQEDGSYMRLGSYQIRNRLNDLFIPSRTGAKWSQSSVMDIIRNPVYAGLMRWQWRKVIKKMVNGIIMETRPKDDDCLKIQGHFTAIITPEQYELAQKIRLSQPTSNPAAGNALQNPLSGIIYCAKCGALMTRAASNTKLNYPVLRCPNRKCDNISAPLFVIEEQLLIGLKKWVSDYEFKWVLTAEIPHEESLIPFKKAAIKELELQQITVKKQLSSAYDFLEQGIYTIEVFRDRNRQLESQRIKIEKQLKQLERELDICLQQESARHNFVPEVKRIVEVYKSLEGTYAKNSTLRGVLERVEYLKSERNKKGQADRPNFELKLYPKIPRNNKV